jgi:hypothetical protein
MRFATIRTDQGTTAARLDADVLVPLEAGDVGEMLAGTGAGGARERAAIAWVFTRRRPARRARARRSG